MNMAIWGVLFLLGWFTAYLLIERLLALVPRREANARILAEVIETWRRECRISPPAQLSELGWLGRLFANVSRDVKALFEVCHWERREVDRFEGTFLTTGSLAMALGLLGTFLALRENATGAADPVQVIGLGLGASTVGLGINIVATLFAALLRGRTYRLRYQIDSVLETLEEIQRADPPGAAVRSNDIPPVNPPKTPQKAKAQPEANGKIPPTRPQVQADALADALREILLLARRKADDTWKDEQPDSSCDGPSTSCDRTNDEHQPADEGHELNGHRGALRAKSSIRAMKQHREDNS